MPGTPSRAAAIVCNTSSLGLLQAMGQLTILIPKFPKAVKSTVGREPKSSYPFSKI